MNKSTLLDNLNKAVLSLQSSDSWQSWLRTRRAFHTYSFRNQLLIMVQTPMREDPPKSGNLIPTAEQATRVAGFRKWLELGYQVQAGSKAIYILAPMRPSKKRIKEARERGEREPRTLFGPAAVFDVSQTEPIEGKARPLEPPTPWGHATGKDDPDLFTDLEAAALALGVDRVDLTADGPAGVPPGARGAYVQEEQHVIWVDENLSRTDAVKTLCHELAHHIDLALPLPPMPDDIDRQALIRAIREAVAESAAYLVCDGLEIDAGDCTITYLASWTSNAEDPAPVLSAVAGRVLDVTAQIEEALAHVRLDPDDPAGAAAGQPAAVAA